MLGLGALGGVLAEVDGLQRYRGKLVIEGSCLRC